MEAFKNIQQSKHPPNPKDSEFDFENNIDILKLDDLELTIFNKIERIDYFLL